MGNIYGRISGWYRLTSPLPYWCTLFSSLRRRLRLVNNDMIKVIILGLFLLTSICNGQNIDCKKYLEYKYDKMTGDTAIAGNAIKIIKTKENKGLIFYFIRD